MGGSKTQKSEVPGFVTEGGNFGVDRAMDLAQMGYMPYFGPDVAALSPMQYSGMQNTNSAAQAFGMAAPAMGGGPPAQAAQAAPMQGGGQMQSAPQGGNVNASDAGGFLGQVAQIMANQHGGGQNGGQAGGPAEIDPLTGLLSMAGNYGGMRAYSSGPMYQGAIDQLAQRRPGQFAAYENMFIDPQAGRMNAEQQQQPNYDNLLAELERQQQEKWSRMR